MGNFGKYGKYQHKSQADHHQPNRLAILTVNLSSYDIEIDSSYENTSLPALPQATPDD
jgi:hypothetical protein